jgi:YggT family protein
MARKSALAERHHGSIRGRALSLVFLFNFINLFVLVFNFLLLARVLMSWVNPNPASGPGAILVDLTEPILGPLRKVLPKSQMFDFSPLVAFILLQVLSGFANRLVAQ